MVLQSGDYIPRPPFCLLGGAGGGAPCVLAPANGTATILRLFLVVCNDNLFDKARGAQGMSARENSLARITQGFHTDRTVVCWNAYIGALSLLRHRQQYILERVFLSVGPFVHDSIPPKVCIFKREFAYVLHSLA